MVPSHDAINELSQDKVGDKCHERQQLYSPSVLSLIVSVSVSDAKITRQSQDAGEAAHSLVTLETRGGGGEGGVRLYSACLKTL